MSGWLTGLGPTGAALALLILGHVLADFVFQTDAMARNKHRIRPLLTHVGIVVVVQLVVFIPLLTPLTALIVILVGIVHLLIDAITARLRWQGAVSEPVRFLGDQSTHLLVILVAWSLMDWSAWAVAPFVTALGGLTDVPWAAITAGAVYLSAFAFADEGGNAIVRGVLPDEGPVSEDEADDLAVGHLIGSLERWIILILGLAGMWQAVALVVAVKSIARFEELKQRAFAEYFLVGTLTSVLVAIVLVGLVLVVV